MGVWIDEKWKHVDGRVGMVETYRWEGQTSESLEYLERAPQIRER